MNKLVLRDSDIFVPRRSLVSDPGVMPESPYIGVDALSRAPRRWSRYWLQPRTTLVPYTIGLHGLGLGGGGCCGAVPGTPFPALSGCCASCDRGGPCTGASGCGGVGEVTMETARPYVLPVLVGAALGYLARGSWLGTAVGGALGAGAYWAYDRIETGIASAVAAIARGQASAPPPAGAARLATPRPLPGLSSFLNDLDPRPAPGEDASAAHSRASLRYVQLGVALSAIALIFEVTTRRRRGSARAVNRRRGRKVRMRVSNPTKKLGGGDKRMIEIMVGNRHVSESPDEVGDWIANKLVKGTHPTLVRLAKAYAKKVHEKNRKMYVDVMSGRIRNTRRKNERGRMLYQQEIRGRWFATNDEHLGVFELRGGAYTQHRGTGQTPRFKNAQHFRRYVLEMTRR